MYPNYLGKSQCSCHKLLLLGDAEATIDDDSIQHAIETLSNISRYLSFEQATVGMMAMRVFCSPHQNSQSVFPHDCEYIRNKLFADIDRDHPIYWGMTGAKRALENWNKPESYIEKVEPKLDLSARNSYPQLSTQSGPSREVISTNERQELSEPIFYSTPQQTRRPSHTSDARLSLPNLKLDNYKPKTLAAMIVDYDNPVEHDGCIYYPGPPVLADGLSRKVMKDMASRRIERVITTSYCKSELEPNTFWVRFNYTCTRKRRNRANVLSKGRLPLVKLIYCQNAAPALTEYLLQRAAKTSRDNLFMRYPSLMKLLPSNISAKPDYNNTSLDTEHDDYDSDADITSESSGSNYSDEHR